jgi:predicted dithiol-disulfide oxidoreductase (DUF899 family)
MTASSTEKVQPTYDILQHPVVAHEEWLAARTQLLAEEKEFTRLRDRLSQRRRELPWEAVDREYVFEGPHGRQTLAALFDGRSQLVVYHAMFDPATASPATSWTVDAACHGCSFWADNFNGIVVHLNHRDVTLVAVSRALRGDRRLQAAHGLDLPVGFVGRY